MEIYQSSLRFKMFMVYITGLVLVSGFVVLSWRSLNTLEEMVTAGEAVTDLFDTALEIRRYEKNYFLYKTDEDYEELLGYIEKAEGLLKMDAILLFTDPKTIGDLNVNMAVYRELLRKDREVHGLRQKSLLEGRIRDIGKHILLDAEKISTGRKEIKKDRLKDAKRHLMVGIMLLLAAGMAGGIGFYSKAVRPLSVLEGHMRRITEGEFSLIKYAFRDREFVSLQKAFNKMLLELHERQRHIVQSEKLASLGTLVFGVAHELNNPLSNISTSCQILREEIDSADMEHKKELLEQIESETDRARDVVGSVLEFSRSKEKTKFFLKRAVQETMRFLRAEVPPKVTIREDIPDDLFIYADRQNIQHMILNLVTNAIDAMPGSGEIVVSASVGKKQVQIEVRDTGEGIGKETVSKIFDPFFSSKKGKKGYGLGLFIVHNIVEEHEGTIDVQSEPGHGTLFTITLPLKEPQENG